MASFKIICHCDVTGIRRQQPTATGRDRSCPAHAYVLVRELPSRVEHVIVTTAGGTGTGTSPRPCPLLRCHGLAGLGCTLDGMERLDRITIEPGKMGGQPCIRGHRFTVEHLLTLVGAGWTLEQIQADFPFIEAGDLQQAAAYAAFSVREYHLPVSRPA